MSIEIDWSKAPEGATHYAPSTDDWADSFMKLEGDIWYAQSGYDDNEWIVDDTGDDPSRYISRYVAWTGEGLPPVGASCEMLSHGEEESEWIEVQILAHTKIYGEDHAVFQYEEHVGTGGVHSCFRPIRTEEQRKVDLILSEIEALYVDGGPAAVYDAGYRKVTL